MRLLLSLLFLAAIVLAAIGAIWLTYAATLPHQALAGALIAFALLLAAITGAAAVAEDQSRQEIALLRAILDRLPPKG